MGTIEIVYKQYTVRATGYKYCVVNTQDESEIKKVQERMPNVTVVPSNYRITAPHMVLDIEGRSIMHIYTRLKNKVSYTFNEYMVLRKAPEIFILRNHPTAVYRGAVAVCTACGKRIRGYYVPSGICLMCASVQLLDTTVLYVTPRYEVGLVEKRGNILMRGSTAFIFCSKVQSVGIINYLAQHASILDDATEVHLYGRRMKSFYLDIQKSEYTSYRNGELS